jgi:cell division protein FtsB
MVNYKIGIKRLIIVFIIFLFPAFFAPYLYHKYEIHKLKKNIMKALEKNNEYSKRLDSLDKTLDNMQKHDDSILKEIFNQDTLEYRKSK